MYITFIVQLHYLKIISFKVLPMMDTKLKQKNVIVMD